MAKLGEVKDSYIIVGAGVFGSSVALHPIQKYPFATVTLIDRTSFPSQAGASWDCNKVIRADYTNALYMELGMEAMEWWRSDPLYQAFYHESGLVWVDNKGLPRTIINNYKKLNANDKYRLVSPEEAKQLWNGIHADANYRGVTEMLVNESSGWADATAALTKVIETAVTSGVKYVVADVEAVVFDDQGSSTGVRTEKGDLLTAAHIILATGAMTAKLLADSAPQRKEMQVGDRVVAAAICTGMVTLDNEDAEYFGSGPVFIHEIGNTLGQQVFKKSASALTSRTGGSIPPNTANQLKFYRDVSFTNTIYHEASRQSISMPPIKHDYAQWELSPGMQKEVKLVSQGIYGEKGKDWRLENYRICW